MQNRENNQVAHFWQADPVNFSQAPKALEWYENMSYILSYHQGDNMSKERITVTIDEDLVKEIDRTAKIIKRSRSYMVEEAIGTWKRVQIERGLKEGYLAMAEEDLATAEANLPAYETLK